MKPSELLQRIVKPESVLDRGALYELGRELDRMLGDGDGQFRQARNLAESLTLRTWTPQLWQNGAQLAITTDSASFVTVGPIVFVHTRVTVAAAGAVGVMEFRNLPHPALYTCIGGETVVFVGGVNRVGATRMTAGSTTTVMTVDNSAADFGVAPAVALAIGNGIRMSAIYLRQVNA
jgi:hypothetical protein